MKTLLFLIVLAFGLVSAQAQSCMTATCTAASMNEADVLAALPSSSNPNATVVVNLPSGTASWTTPLAYTVPSTVTNLTIQGQTAITFSGTFGGPVTYTVADNSVMVDAINSNTSPIAITMAGQSTYFRLTGISVEGSTGLAKYSGVLQMQGPGHNMRLDHIHFDNNYNTPTNTTFIARLYGDINGVVDHVVCDNGTGTTTNCVGMSNTTNDTSGYGYGTWIQPTNFGSSNFIFFEDSVVNGGEAQDCDDAGRFVIRYTSLLNGSTGSAIIHNHGTKTPSGNFRSCRAYEAYHNYIVGPTTTQYAAIGSNGGPSLVWGNNMASGYYWLASMATVRNDGSEQEVNTPNGWGFCGTSAINPSTGSANGTGSAWDGNSSTTTGYPCLDGLGRGQAAQTMSGVFPNTLNSTTGTIAYPQEYLEPIYYFDNTFPGASEVAITDISTQMNRDVYEDNSSFNGTTGTGTGTLANRPTTCTAGPGGTYGTSPTGSYGVAYFATDANSGQGELYVCTATNTWTATYEPYTYPHPLDTTPAVSSGNVLSGGMIFTSGTVMQ